MDNFCHFVDIYSIILSITLTLAVLWFSIFQVNSSHFKGVILSDIYSENPFLDVMKIETRRGKQVKVSGSSGVQVLTEGSREPRDAHLITYNPDVDSESFVKIFSKNIGMMFDLSPAGVKVLSLLIWEVQRSQNKDVVILDRVILEEFLAVFTDLRMMSRTLSRGITDLINAKIIARTKRRGQFFMNTAFCFNGNRMIISSVTGVKKRRRIGNG